MLMQQQQQQQQPELESEVVKLRQKKTSHDDYEVMPDAKRRSIIANHVADSMLGPDQNQRRRSWHESEHSLDRVMPDGHLHESRAHRRCLQLSGIVTVILL